MLNRAFALIPSLGPDRRDAEEGFLGKLALWARRRIRYHRALHGLQRLDGRTWRTECDTALTGGNPDLTPEISKTTVLGASFAPSFMRGFNVSVDYYDIKIRDAIAALNGSSLTLACASGNQSACDRVTRDSTGTVTFSGFGEMEDITAPADAVNLTELISGWG